MDFSKFKTSDWLKIGGAAVFLISGLFLDWAKIEFLGVSETGNSVFNYPFRGLVSMVLVVGIGVVSLLGLQGKQVGKVQWPLISVVATAVASILMLLLVIMGPDDSGFDFKPAIGLWLAFIATLAALAGSVMGFTAGGGNLKDLTDIDKIKRGLGQE